MKLKNIKKQSKYIAIMVLLFSFFPFVSYAEIPNQINYQGKLKDSGGNPITAPTTIQFSLYSHITNGNSTDIPNSSGPLLWTETYDGSGSCAQITPDSDGIFAQHLGNCVPFPSYLDFTDEYYLGVKIGADAEATPRVPFATNPYAFTSKAVHAENEDINIDTETSGDIVLNSVGNIQLQANDATSALIVDQQGTGNLFELQNNGTTTFIVDGNGRVGIGGILNPGKLLEVNGTAGYLDASDMGMTDADFASKGYVDEQLMWEIVNGGERIQPKNNSVRQIYVEEDSNSYTQFMVRNNNDTGNGAGAIIELKGSGADYTNNMYIGKYGASFWIPELQNNGAVLTDKNLVIGTASDSQEIHFVTGNSYNDLQPVAVADNEGFRYTSDLSATFVDRTLVDKAYVDNAIDAGTTASNGLTKISNDIQLGGLLTADTFINKSGHSMRFNGDGFFQTQVYSNGHSYYTNVEQRLDSYTYFLQRNSDGYRNTFEMTPTYMRFSDAINNRGVEYADDYSANYTNRSLVDKAYVDSRVGTSIFDVDADTGIQAEANSDEDYIRMQTAGTERLIIDNNGNTGINIGSNSLVSVMQIGPGTAESSTFAVAADPNYMNIATFRDQDGENIFRSMGSLSNNDLIVTFGDWDWAYNHLSFGINTITDALEFYGGDFRLYELGGSQSDYIGFRAPNDVTSNIVWTLPSADGLSNYLLQTDGSGNLSWADPSIINGINIYNSDGTLTENRTVSLNGNNLLFSGSGNIGIGVSNPVNKLQVNGNVRATRFVGSNGTQGSPIFRFDSDADTGMFRGGANQLAFSTGGNERMRIDDNGRVGIGTASPDQMLQISGNTHINRVLQVDDSSMIYTNHTYNDNTFGELYWNLLQTQKTDDPNDAEFATITSGTGWKQTAPITRWKVGDEKANGQHYGYVGYFPLDGWHPSFRINTSGKDDTNLSLGAMSKDVINITASNLFVGIGTDIPTAQLHTTGGVRFSHFGAGTMQTDANGNVSVSSDERLKNIQGDFDRGLEDLLQLRPIEYKWKKETGYDTENSYYGFSAQNVQMSIPEAVGKDNRGFLTLADRPILATVVNAIKEQQQQIDALGGHAVDSAQTIKTKLVDDVRNVLEEVVFTAEVEFEKTTTFFADVIFTDKVTFMDRVTFADKDMAGTAIIEKGDDEIKVKFDKDFVFTPFVTATVNNAFVLYKVTDVTESSFKIKIQEEATKDIQFTWQAITVGDTDNEIIDDEDDNIPENSDIVVSDDVNDENVDDTVNNENANIQDNNVGDSSTQNNQEDDTNIATDDMQNDTQDE